MAGAWNTIIYGGVALAVAFIFLGSMIMPMFSTSYNPATCLATSWITNATGNHTICADLSVSRGTTVPPYPGNTTAAQCTTGSVVCCEQCTNWSYRDTYRGMLLLIFILAIVAFAVYFMPKIRR